LQEILVLDGIDTFEDGFVIQCHDLHGQLPEIKVKNSSDFFEDKDRLGREAVCSQKFVRQEIQSVKAVADIILCDIKPNS
jgi:hypothetical protein